MYDPANKETAVYDYIKLPGYEVDYDVNIGAITLGEFIDYCQHENHVDLVFPIGFINPHSYRGSYDELAFEPARNVPVKVTLELARASKDVEFQGYKGGWFKMNEDTSVYCSTIGSGWSGAITHLLLDALLGRIET